MTHSLEARVFHLSQDLTQTDPSAPALSDDEIITKLNMCVQMIGHGVYLPHRERLLMT